MNTHNIIGQSTLIKGLQSILDRGRIVHSYIFAGPEGIGKKTISNFFAKMLLCMDEDKPCYKCKSCRQLDSGNHPDVIRIESENNAIKVDVIRGIRRGIGIKPFQGSWKIYIIEDGDAMNQQAQNAFLKTLEEPPKHAIIIILARNLTSLYPTILSRCQQFRVPPLSTKDIIEVICNKTQISREEAFVFAKLSEGVVGKGLKLADSHEYQQMREDTLALLEKLTISPLVEVFEYIDYFLENRERIMEILDIMELWFRDALIIKQDNCADLITNLDELTRIKSLAGNFTIPSIQCIIEGVEDSKRMLKSHANFQLTIENMLMKIQGSGDHAGSSGSTI